MALDTYPVDRMMPLIPTDFSGIPAPKWRDRLRDWASLRNRIGVSPMMQESAQIFLISPGPRPRFGLVAEFLWPGRDVDTDGDSDCPTSSSWTELTIALRPNCAERVDVDPVSQSPLVLKVSATSNELASRAATFLQEQSGGTLSASWG